MKKLSFLISFIFALTAISVSCQNADTQTGYKNISVQELKQDMKTDSNLVILDVRTPQELTGELGQIPGVVNIPLQVLANRVNELDKYKNKDLAVICRSGHRSSIASKLLQEKGFKVMNVLGGMIAYNQDK